MTSNPFHLDALASAHLRVARPTDRMDEVQVFYTRAQEHLLVFYLPDFKQWQAAVDHIESLGIPSVPSHNPYWDRNGRTFEDPDGYRVVLQNAAWAQQ